MKKVTTLLLTKAAPQRTLPFIWVIGAGVVMGYMLAEVLARTVCNNCAY